MDDGYFENSIVGLDWINTVRKSSKIDILKNLLTLIQEKFPNILNIDNEDVKKYLNSTDKITTAYTLLILKEIWIKNECVKENYPNFFGIIENFIDKLVFDDFLNFIPIFQESSKVTKLEALFSYSPFNRDKNSYFTVPVYESVENIEKYFQKNYQGAKKILNDKFSEIYNNFLSEILSNKKYPEIVSGCENIYDYIFEGGNMLSIEERRNIDSFYEKNSYLVGILENDDLLFPYYNKEIEKIKEKIESLSYNFSGNNIDYKTIFSTFSLFLNNEILKSKKMLPSFYFLYFIILILIYNIYSGVENYYLKIGDIFDINEYLKIFSTDMSKLQTLIITDITKIFGFINFRIIFDDLGIVEIINTTMKDFYILKMKYEDNFNLLQKSINSALIAKKKFVEFKTDVKKLINYKYRSDEKPYILAYYWKIYFETYGTEDENKLYYLKNNVIYESSNLDELNEDYIISLRSCK